MLGRWGGWWDGEAASDYQRPEDKVIGRRCRLSQLQLRPCLYSKLASRLANTYHYVNNKLGRLRFSSTLRFFPFSSSLITAVVSISSDEPRPHWLLSFSCSGWDIDAAQSPLPSHNSSLKSTSTASRAHSCHTASASWSTTECNSFNAMAPPMLA